MTQKSSIRDEPKKKTDLQALYEAIKQMNETERATIAGAIAFATVWGTDTIHPPTTTNRPA